MPPCRQLSIIRALFCSAILMLPFHYAGAHSGGTNAEGCHAGSQPYHCHEDSNMTVKKAKRKHNEDYYNRKFCSSIGGATEVKHAYSHPGGNNYVKVDCENDTHIYEGGLDKRSSLDSIQQALFFSYLTGKKPAVVIYDTDGEFGQFEYRIMKACEMVGVEFTGVNLK